MAIQGDTAAIIAAQLTNAWATLFAANPGVGGLPESELMGRVALAYESFRGAVTEVNVGEKYDLRKLIE